MIEGNILSECQADLDCFQATCLLPLDDDDDDDDNDRKWRFFCLTLAGVTAPSLH